MFQKIWLKMKGGGYTPWHGGPDGAALVSEPSRVTVIYEDATYKYICEAAHGSARTDSVWRITRIAHSTSDIDYSGLSFDQPADDLATVAALTYNSGVAI